MRRSLCPAGHFRRICSDQPPKWLRLQEGQVRFLSLTELNQGWRGLCKELSPEEWKQIRYWQPQTVGEIIFNTWD